MLIVQGQNLDLGKDQVALLPSWAEGQLLAPIELALGRGEAPVPAQVLHLPLAHRTRAPELSILVGQALMQAAQVPVRFAAQLRKAAPHWSPAAGSGAPLPRAAGLQPGAALLVPSTAHG